MKPSKHWRNISCWGILPVDFLRTLVHLQPQFLSLDSQAIEEGTVELELTLEPSSHDNHEKKILTRLLKSILSV